jgi:hypothetical protein
VAVDVGGVVNLPADCLQVAATVPLNTAHTAHQLQHALSLPPLPGWRAAGPQAPAAPSSVAHHMGGSQTSSQAAAAATERVRAHILARVEKAGQINLTDVATCFCMASGGHFASPCRSADMGSMLVGGYIDL